MERLNIAIENKKYWEKHNIMKLYVYNSVHPTGINDAAYTNQFSSKGYSAFSQSLLFRDGTAEH